MKKSVFSLCFLLRFFIFAIACFLPFSSPHLWRQTDTMGIAYRYFSRFFFEDLSSHFWLNLVPASLNSSDHYGYVATEFPVLNILASLFFSLGVSPGQIAARLFLLLVLGLVIVCIARWKDLEFPNGVSFAKVALVFPVVSLGGVYFGKFLPDPLATLLVFLAVVASWEKPRSFLSLFSATLGLLIKPTSILVFGLLLFRPQKLLKRVPWWVPLSILVCAAYYKGLVPVLLGIQDSPFPFQINPKPPFQTLRDFLMSFRQVVYVFGRSFFSQLGLLLMLIGYLFDWRRFSKTHWALWGLLVFQFFMVGMLDGVHSFEHTYYFLGLHPTALLILLEFLSVMTPTRRGWSWKNGIFYGLLIVLVFNTVKFSARDLQLFDPSSYFVKRYQSSCTKLKERNPDLPWNRGYVFRSPNEVFPELGLCFGERSGSTQSQFGFFPVGEFNRAECSELDRDKALVLVQCPTGSKEK